jgi:hypothetical protein
MYVALKTRAAGRAASLVAVSIVWVMSCALPVNGFTQAPQPTVTLVEPPVPLLPKQFGAWQQQTPVDPNTAAAPAIDPSLQGIFKEDGITRTAAFAYSRGGSAETVLLKAYQFIDATGAFSAFTTLRTPEYRPVAGLGMSAVERGDVVLIWNGPTVVQAEFKGGHRAAELTDLVSTLPKVGGPKGDPPLLPTFLPAKGLLNETVKYALGPESYSAMGGVLPSAIAGFDKSAEAVTAKYAGRGTLTLLLYPTPQIAGDHGREIEAEMNREGAAAGTVKLRREGELVLLTTGAWPAAEAQRLVDDIHLRTELTWNKPIPPEFHVEVRKTASLLFSIIGLSIALMAAATVLGLFFGGGRAMVRILQGKPAASEPEFLRIDLRDRPGEQGSFKPLH